MSQPHDGEHLKYFFHKGKSCLFQINLHALHTHLLSTPLYAMVLDVKDEIPKLIGSSLISLAKVMEKIKLDVDKHGIGNPSAYGERLTTPICNLMGNSIGVISLAYKIVSLGAHLIPHIPENRVYEVGGTRGKGEKHWSVRAKCNEKDEMPPEVPENHPGNVLLQHISLDGQSTDILISGAKQPGVPAFTQTEQAQQRVSWSEDAQEYTTFCPPPLFYSSSVKNRRERKSLGKTTLVKEVCDAVVSAGVSVSGFYTEEVRERGRRVGFDVVTITGDRGRLSRLRRSILGTIPVSKAKPLALVEEVCSRQDVKIFMITKENRDVIFDDIVSALQE